MKTLIFEVDAPSEAEKTAVHIVALEKAALDKWFSGDTSGYANLWSQRSFSYFDAVGRTRVDSHATITAFLETIEGKLFAENYDFRDPRVQLSADMAVLAFQLFAKSTLLRQSGGFIW